jgi:DNA mismatch repair protein MutS
MVKVGAPKVGHSRKGGGPSQPLSVLDPGPRTAAREGVGEQPAFFADLHLDQVTRWALAGREEYDLASFFWRPLPRAEDVRYRQEVARDLEKPEVARSVRGFAEKMRWARTYLRGMEKLEGPRYQEGWFLDAAESYCAAVRALADGFERAGLSSRALKALQAYLATYTASTGFSSLEAQVRRLKEGLAEVGYCLLIRGRRVTVKPYESETDLSQEIEATFVKFRNGVARDFRAEFRDLRDANHVHAQVLERVARLYPELFASLRDFCSKHQDFVDGTVAAFDREVQFYLAYLEFLEPLKALGLPFCYPQVSETSQDIEAKAAFDIALAKVLADRGRLVVTNDIELTGAERVLVVTGPNQGGKTTFARMFGQLHFLASLGLPVPGEHARLFLADRVFCHFERAERLDTLHGKLVDELNRVRATFEEATGHSLLVMNETFSSTTLTDSRFIGQKVLQQVSELGALCVYVTFVDELASLNEATVSMVAEVDPEDPDVRTFKVTRKPADGRAYAKALARKYGLAYSPLRERVRA